MALLRMESSLRDSLSTLVLDGYPHETCGVLIGRQSDGLAEVRRVEQARNLNTDRAHDRFDLDPSDYQAADESARAEGLEIIGIWHSHPDHPAQPSETDRQAAWPGWSYMILSVSADAVQDIRSWRLDGEQFFEETIEA